MRDPRKAFRSWRDSVSNAIAVEKSKREFNKVLENRPYSIVQCEAAHQWAEHLANEVAPARSWGGASRGLPDLGTKTGSASRIPPWYTIDIKTDKISHKGWNNGDPIDTVRRAAIDDTFRVGSTWHLVPLGGDSTPPLIVRINPIENRADISTSFGLLRHRNTAAYINCMECHNYASEWLSRMVIPGAPVDERPPEIGRFTRLVVQRRFLQWAIRGILLIGNPIDIPSYLETAVEWGIANFPTGT